MKRNAFRFDVTEATDEDYIVLVALIVSARSVGHVIYHNLIEWRMRAKG